MNVLIKERKMLDDMNVIKQLQTARLLYSQNLFPVPSI